MRVSSTQTAPWSCLLLLACVVTTGCGKPPDSYERIRRVYRGTSGGEEGQGARQSVDAAAARRELIAFCATRGVELIGDSTSHRSDDLGLLVTAILLNGLGAVFTGVAAFLADDLGATSDIDDGFAVAGLSSIGLGSMVFGIRAAIPIDGLQRAERTAADELVRAATDMAEHAQPGDAEFDSPADRCIAALSLVHGAYTAGDTQEVREILQELRQHADQHQPGAGSASSGSTSSEGEPTE